MARAPIEWAEEDRRQFENLCGIFATQNEICTVMGVDKKTLARLIADNYPETPTWAAAFELFSGKGKASLRRRQFQAALDGDRTMLIWLGKNYLGQSETGAQIEAEPQLGKLEQFRGAKARRRA